MPTYYIAFSGGRLVKAPSPEEALDEFYADSTGDQLLDAIEEREVYTTSKGKKVKKLVLED
jgi:hypothetical protein